MWNGGYRSMSNISIFFTNPFFLLFIVLFFGAALVLYLVLNKRRRKDPNRIASLVIHFVIITLICSVLSGINIKINDTIVGNDIVFLVDVSDSNKASFEDMNTYLKREIKAIDKNNRISFVTFGNNNNAAVNFTRNASQALSSFTNNAFNSIDSKATNIKDAIDYSLTLFDSASPKHLIILTDGRETDGNLYASMNQYKDIDVRIDAIYFANDVLNNDIQYNDFLLPDNVILNRPATAKITLLSNYTCTPNLKIYDNDNLIFNENVNVSKGINELSISLTFTVSGLHDIRSVIEDNDDLHTENNEIYYNFDLSSNEKILIIDGTGSEANKLALVLEDEYTIDVNHLNELTPTLDYLNNYGEVIAMNVNASDFPGNFVNNLQTYVRQGGGLLTTGGNNTYHFGNMEGSYFEEMLPINAKLDENEPIAIMLIIDNSSSMRETIAGSTKTKLELAKESAIASVNQLRDYDYAGVITFDANAKVVCPLTLVSQKETIIQRINSIQLGYGTAYAEAFKLANTQMVSFNQASKKHIIFTSDGNPTDSGYIERLSYIRAKGITTSTIGIGDDLNMTTLEQLAEIGGGNSYNVTNANQLTAIMVTETNNAKGKYINESTDITPKIAIHNQVVNGLMSVPSLTGYIGTAKKDDATVILEYETDVIYATREYGTGKVGSFTSDLNGTYSSNYFEDNRGITFIKNAVRDLYSKNKNRSEMVISCLTTNLDATIVVRTSSNSGQNTVKARIINPLNQSKEVNFALTANNTYTYTDKNFYDLPGTYTVELIKETSRGEVYATYHTTFSYSQEYNNFDNVNYEELLAKFCLVTNGKLYHQDESIFSDEAQIQDVLIDPRVILLITALVLFVVNIVVRKFKFKKQDKKMEGNK